MQFKLSPTIIHSASFSMECFRYLNYFTKLSKFFLLPPFTLMLFKYLKIYRRRKLIFHLTERKKLSIIFIFWSALLFLQIKAMESLFKCNRKLHSIRVILLRKVCQKSSRETNDIIFNHFVILLLFFILILYTLYQSYFINELPAKPLRPHVQLNI